MSKMINMEIWNKARTEHGNEIFQAFKDNDTEKFQIAWLAMSETLQNEILQMATTLQGETDVAILASRGIRQLTAEEKEFYQKWADNAKGPKQALTGMENILPKTIVDSVWEGMTKTFPLLDDIGFMEAGALVEILISSTGGVADWGDLCATIKDQLSANFDKIDLAQKKLSAYIPVCNAMLDLGPEWLDNYVRTMLTQALQTALELAIIDGDGDGKPRGMTRASSGATDGVYPRKTPIVVTSFAPEEYGALIAQVAVDRNGQSRAVTEVGLIVNPTDYFTKVMPATTAMNTANVYVGNIFPFPTKVYQSPAVPVGHAVLGIINRYFFALGTGKGGNLEFSDHYQFLEDHRVYRIKLYGNGQPLEDSAFLYLDISGLQPLTFRAQLIGGAAPAMAFAPAMAIEGNLADMSPEKLAALIQDATQLLQSYMDQSAVPPEDTLSTMSKDELTAHATSLGIEVKTAWTKEQIIEAIKAAPPTA